jgi:hypothetical protein
MKNKIINLIKLLGFGLNELLMNINLPIGEFDSVEWDIETNKVFLHIFKDDDLDIMLDFDELDEENQLELYKILAIIYN